MLWINKFVRPLSIKPAKAINTNGLRITNIILHSGLTNLYTCPHA